MFSQIIAEAMKSLLFFALHVENINAFPKPLSKSDEEKYFRLMNEENNKEARNILIEHNLRLVAHIIKKYYSKSRDQEELISIGTIGLIKAVSTFNCEKGSRFATYASRCVENEILMYLRRNSKTKMEVSIDEPLNVDWDGNELLLSDILGTENDTVYNLIEDEVDKQLLLMALKNLSLSLNSVLYRLTQTNSFLFFLKSLIHHLIAL